MEATQSIFNEFTDENGVQRKVPKLFDPECWFKFENDEIKNKVLGAYNDPGNCGLTDEMRNFKPMEEVLQFGNGKPQRLVYSDVEYTDEEKAAIKSLIDYAQ